MKRSLKCKNLNTLRRLVLLGLLVGNSCFAGGQASEVNGANQLQLPTEFLGWNNTVNSTLEIRHDTPNQPIIFRTSGLERMRIKPDARISINTTSSLGGSRFTVLQKEVISAKRILEINHELVEMISA